MRQKLILPGLIVMMLLTSGCAKETQAPDRELAPLAGTALAEKELGMETKTAQHIHNYTFSTVAPTESERGYTLFTCQECGDSYKANFVQPTG